MLDSILRYFIYIFRYSFSFIYDLNRYVKYSNKKYKKLDSHVHKISKIITLYHVLEKGLSMEDIKPNFGRERADLLIYYLKSICNEPNIRNNVHYKASINVLHAYQTHLKSSSVQYKELDEFLMNCSCDYNGNFGGTKLVKSLQENDALKMSFSDLVSNRNSVRFFNGIKVNENTIQKAIQLAINSPSSCNRQSFRVIKVPDDKIDDVLNVQGGANGYKDRINTLLAIGFDIESYQGVGDRYSGYIDASIFGSSLLYSFTSYGVHTLALNWSKPYKIDQRLRNIWDIKDSITICFFIAVGYIDDETRIPYSVKSDINDVYIK